MTLTRRNALIQVATAGCALAASPTLLGAAQRTAETSSAKKKPTVGIATFGFPTLTNADLAKDLAEAGIHTVQLFLSQKDSQFWRYNSRADVSTMTPERCGSIAETYRSAGIQLHSIGVYTNLIHPDVAERKANLEYFRAMMEVGRHMGVRVFITEAGHHSDPKTPEPSVPLHFQDAVWPQMVGTMRELAKIAEEFEARVLLEPFYRSFLASAKRVRVFLEEVGSPRIRALLDPANLIEINDLEEMFQQLGPWIDCLHAKDRKLHTEAGVPAGEGHIDYQKFVTLAARYTPHAPLILEYVGPKDYRKALAHLRGALQRAGLES